MIAFLISAHHEPETLRRLVEALDEPWVQFFIHVDAKTEIAPFLAALKDLPRVHFVDKRVKVYWAGWSQIEATLTLMRAAFETEPACERFVFISGACYPTRSNKALRDFLLAEPLDYITSVRVPNVEESKPLSRFSCWRFEGGNREKGAKAFGIKLINKVAERLPIRNWKKGLKGLLPYAGSSWWALTRDTVAYILSFAAAHPAILTFFHHVAYPDEAFFQTVIMNSPIASRVRRNLTYTDWSNPAERPCHITANHVDALTAQSPPDRPCFFARKFSSKNADVAALIEKRRQ
jgi:hypothetical protein